MTGKVRAVADSYVFLAEENQRLFDEFKARYPELLPPADPHGAK